jgi:acetoin utilization deacetylase AcuC-like enzyme
MRVSHHPDYYVPLPSGHPFPMEKYRLIREILLERGVIAAADIMQPEPIELELLRAVHTDEYLDKLANGGLTPQEQRRIGVPWSPALWRRSRLAAIGKRMMRATC